MKTELLSFVKPWEIPGCVRVMSELRVFVLLLNLTVVQQPPQGSDERPVAGKV